MTNVLEIETRRELRDWLFSCCDSDSHAWAPILSGDPDELSYLAVVEETLCFGWIDSTKKRVGDVLYQRISPRRKGSNWTELNKERARRLTALGLMTPRGEAALPDMSDDGFVICPAIMAAIQSDPETAARFHELPPLYVRVRIDNIQSYPHGDETYVRRLEKFLANTKQGVLYGDWNDKGRLL